MNQSNSSLSLTMYDYIRNIRKSARNKGEWGNENCFPPLCNLFNMRIVVLTDWSHSTI